MRRCRHSHEDQELCSGNQAKKEKEVGVAMSTRAQESREGKGFQEPGEAEEEFAQVDTARLIKSFFTSRDPKPPCFPKEVGIKALPCPPSLPSWLTEEDVDYYAAKFNQSGFTGGLNYYRNMNLSVSD